MEKSLKNKKLLALTKGIAGFAGILLVLFVIFSCNNILITSGGSLIISTPGARAASGSISYTIVVEGSQGFTQRKNLTSGSSVQFDNLAPDTYSISVEGKNEDDAVVLYGTDSATVEAGKTASADVELKKGASDFASLESAVAAGGTVYIFESIDVEKTLSISTDVSVIILPAYQDVTLKNTGDVVMFDVSAGNLTIGGGEHTITLDGNTFSKHAINIKSIGEVTLSSNAVIMNCGTASVKLQNTNYNSTYALFFLEGGTIKDNNGSGVEVSDFGTFTMNSGYIKNNNTSNGGGVSLSGSSSTLKMYGGSITGNQVTGNGAGVYVLNGSLIMSGGEITDNEASGSGGGVYSQKSVAMTGGYIGGNVAASTGNGVYSGNGSSFEMGKSAVIDKNNDVYLMRGITISVTSELTGDSSVATITPNEYKADTAILTNGMGDFFAFTTETGKFAVTPKADGTQWTINTSGNLQQAGAQ